VFLTHFSNIKLIRLIVRFVKKNNRFFEIINEKNSEKNIEEYMKNIELLKSSQP